MPTRSCVACHTRREASELIRLVATPDSGIWLSGGPDRPPGRGASCCRSRACLQRLVDQPERLGKALRRYRLDTSNLLDRAASIHTLS